MRGTYRLASVFTAFALAAAAAQTPKPTKNLQALINYSAAIEELSQKASSAVVQIQVQTLVATDRGDMRRAGFVAEQAATGSGVIVDADGYIVTNAHVVENARHIEVKILQSDDKSESPHAHILPATLVGLDRQVDIAVVKIDAHALPTLEFVDSDRIRQGQFVLAVGSPLGLENSLSHGVISATARQLKADVPVSYIQTDAAINPGNSGGPLLDLQGRVIGINTMIYSESGGNEGIGFAVPANLAKDVYERLRKDGHIRRGQIGVIPETITPRLSAALGLKRDSGVILSDVFPHSAAEAAELQPGDVVVSVDGKPMHEMRDLGAVVFRHAPGDVLTMEIERGTEHLTKRVAVMERPREPRQLEEIATRDATLIRELGVLAVAVDERVTAVLGELRKVGGVAVVAVPTEYAGINPGLIAGDVVYEVNTHPVASLDELRAALKNLKRGDSIAMQVERAQQLIYVSGTLD